MTWNNHESPSVPPALNELGSHAPLYPHVSEKSEPQRDIFKELRTLTLGDAATSRSVKLTESTGYAQKHGDDTDAPEGLSFSA